MKTSTFVSLLALGTSTLALPQWGGFGGGGGSGSSIQNDVTNKAPCKAITIIFARGTSETGNVGSVAGPPFFKALQSSVGADKVAVQGVTYAANWNGAFAGGDAAGSKTMASLVGQVSSTRSILTFRGFPRHDKTTKERKKTCANVGYAIRQSSNALAPNSSSPVTARVHNSSTTQQNKSPQLRPRQSAQVSHSQDPFHLVHRVLSH